MGALMFAVVLHASGRVDAEGLDDLVKRTALIYRNAVRPPMYAILKLCAAQVEATSIASQIRSDRRQANQAKREMGDNAADDGVSK